MKLRVSPFFLLCLLFLILFPLPPTWAANESLYATGARDGTYTGWTTAGTGSLRDVETANYVYTGTNNALTGYYAYDDTTFTTITSVSLYLYDAIASVSGDDYYQAYNGTSGTLLWDFITPGATGLSWHSQDVSSVFDTPTKINQASIYFKYIKVGGTGTQIKISASYLYITGSGGVQTYTFTQSDTPKTTEAFTQLKTLHFSTSDLSKTLESYGQWKTLLFSQTDTLKTSELLTQYRIVIIQLSEIAKTTESLSLKRLLQYIITDLSKTLESFSASLPTPPPPENPTYISSIAITLLFYVLAQGKPAQNVEIEITDATYGTHVMTVWTNEYGMTEDIYLDPGQYNWVASWNGQTKNGTITHDHYDTVRIDLNGDGTKKPAGVPRILQILLGLSIASVAVYFLYQRGRRVNH